MNLYTETTKSGTRTDHIHIYLQLLSFYPLQRIFIYPFHSSSHSAHTMLITLTVEKRFGLIQAVGSGGI